MECLCTEAHLQNGPCLISTHSFESWAVVTALTQSDEISLRRLERCKSSCAIFDEGPKNIVPEKLMCVPASAGGPYDTAPGELK